MAYKIKQRKVIECRDGQYRLFTKIPVVFGKDELIEGLIIEDSEKLPKHLTRNKIIKITKNNYRRYGQYAVISENVDDYDEKYLKAKKIVEELFPELDKKE